MYDSTRVAGLTSNQPPTDREYRLMDEIETSGLLEAPKGATPSAVAKRIRTDTVEAKRLLAYLVTQQMAYAVGNGSWTRYHAGRAR